MISVRCVSKSFGRVRAVRDVSFEVSRGEVVGLLGANGAGKSTTIRIVAGFLPPDAGTVSVGGHDSMTASLEARRCVGYLPEAAPAYAEMATDNFLDFRGRLYGMSRSDRRAGIGRVLDLCELHEVRRRRVGHLSRGYRQRVGLAAAILHNPPVLVLDEPTSALDPRQIRHTRSLIRELARDKAVLVSSHILPEVEKTCDRLVILARGAVRADASPADLLASARRDAPYFVEAWSPAGVEGAAAVFRSVPGMLRVEREQTGAADAWSAFKLTGGTTSGDLRESIARTATQAGVVLRELRRETPGLERLFLDLIERDEPGLRQGGGGSSLQPHAGGAAA